jgi:hypothetical protein
MLDLCCGLGGASCAQRERGWRVIRVDRNRDVAPDVVADIRQLPMRPFTVDLLWASPDCTEFTMWDIGFPRAVARRREPDLSTARAVLSLVEQWRPRFYCVENVRGSRRFLTPIFGAVRARAGGHYLYGNLPLLVSAQLDRKNSSRGRAHDRRRDHLLRSRVPYGLSLDVALTVERLIGG